MAYSVLIFLASCRIPTDITEPHGLFPFRENGKWGFINSAGQVVIEPTFCVVGNFREGLASARTNGRYGYIDETGAYVIEPRFDYAAGFNEGIAVVYIAGRPSFIDKFGHSPFIVNFSAVGQFENGRAIVRTESNKKGLIDKKGKLVVDTVYRNIVFLNEGFAKVEGLNHYPYRDREMGIERNYEVGVIDSAGGFVIPFGLCKEIRGFENGYFKVEIPAEPWDSIYGFSAQTAFLDKEGKLILSRPHSNFCKIDGYFHCGLARMELYENCPAVTKKNWFKSLENYEGFINLNGEIVIDNRNHSRVFDFSDNRAFVQDSNGNFSVIDTKGNTISNVKFDHVIGRKFVNGLAMVQVKGKFGIIDTNANYIMTPRFKEVDEAGIIGEHFFFSEQEDHAGNSLYGIARTDGSILINSCMNDFNREGFQSGVLHCIVDNKFTYLNIEGKIIWQEADKIRNTKSNLNIDFMMRGYFLAASLPDENEHYNGWAQSNNLPKRITLEDFFPKNDISIRVIPEMIDVFANDYHGITVCIANTTNKTVEFMAQDSRLNMKVQALSPEGEWKDIEYLPSSWCGNSYHIVSLHRNHFWTLTTPVYEGEFKTKLRIELSYVDQRSNHDMDIPSKEITIYSNEYDGSVNPGQFWRKRAYFSQGIMDPYGD